MGLPLATRIQETVAMDLRFYSGNILLHLIDHVTRLSTAVHIPSKQPKVIMNAIISNWISVYRAAEKFISDNGGEFVNEEFLILCEQFNIIVQTTAADSPWSNGLVERHNLVLSEILDKVLTDSKCPLNVALSWCINAKNSLHNVHGFSPYQLALGQNPRLPPFFTDTPPAHESPSSSDIVRQHLNALHDARRAFIEAENSEKLKRALCHNVRTANDAMYVNGDKVYHIHQGDTKWRGPAIVLGQDGQEILLKHGGFYVLTHHCHVQHVNPISDKPLEPQAISTPKTTSPSVKDQHVAPQSDSLQ